MIFPLFSQLVTPFIPLKRPVPLTTVNKALTVQKIAICRCRTVYNSQQPLTPQPSPIQTDNSIASDVVNNEIVPQK